MASNIENLSYYTFLLSSEAKQLFQKKDCMNNLGARALYVAQIISSIVAIPLTLLTGIGTTIHALCTREEFSRRECAWNEITDTALMMSIHLIFIPFMLYKAIVPDAGETLRL